MDMKAVNTPSGGMQTNPESMDCNPSTSFDSSSDIRNGRSVKELDEFNPIQADFMSVESDDSYTTAVDALVEDSARICAIPCASSTLLEQSQSDGESVPWIVKKFCDVVDSYEMNFHEDDLYLPPEVEADNEMSKHLKRLGDCFGSAFPDSMVCRFKFDRELSAEENEYFSSRNMSTVVLSDDNRVEEDSLNMLPESMKFENPTELLISNPNQCQFGPNFQINNITKPIGTAKSFYLFDDPVVYNSNIVDTFSKEEVKGTKDIGSEDDRNQSVSDMPTAGSKPRSADIGDAKCKKEVKRIKGSGEVKVPEIRKNLRRKSKDVALASLKRL